MTESLPEPPLWIELPAVVAGALAGALFAQRRGLDLIGVFALALVSGLGGGILRDVLLARIPLALRESWYLVTVAGGALVGGFFAAAANRVRLALQMIDAISLGLFTVIGVEGGLAAGLPVTTAILLGTITGVGGSVIRDLLVGEAPPRMLRRGPPYATAAVLGAAVYVGLVAGLDVRKVIALLSAVAVVLLVRGVATWRRWGTPEPHDLTPTILRPRNERGPAGPRDTGGGGRQAT